MLHQNSTMNRQVIRTRQWIFEALLQLMQEKSFDEISVTEITKKAGVARQTFYRNYNDKYDVIQKYVDIIFDEFMEEANQQKDLSIEDVYKLYFNILKNYQAQLTMLCYVGSNDIIYKTFCGYDEVFLRILNCQCYSKTTESEFSKYFVKYQLGGIINVTIEWLSQNMRTPPAKMARILLAITVSYSNDERYLPHLALNSGIN